MAFEPDIYKNIISKNRSKLILIFVLIVGMLLLMTLTFIVLSEWITDLLTSGRYTRSYVYANLNMIGFFFMQIYGLLTAIMNALKRTRAVFFINAFASIFAIFVYKILIEKYEFLGGCYGRISIALLLCIMGFLFLSMRNNKVVRKII